MRTKISIVFICSIIYSAIPLIAGMNDDGQKTIGFWKMDQVEQINGEPYILDHDINYPRDNDLQLNLGSPTITTGGAGYFGGEALSFNGIDQRADADWPGGVSVKIEFWAYINSNTTNQSITAVNGAWDMQIMTSGNIRVYVWDRDSQVNQVEAPVSTGWNHIIFIAAPGKLYLDVNGNTDLNESFSDMRHTIEALTIGNKVSATRWFDGLIDEFHISQPTKAFTPTEPYEASSCNSLLWHADNFDTFDNVNTVAQDPNGLNRLEMLYGNQPASGTNGPDIVSSLTNFDNSLQFNGLTDGTRVIESVGENLGIDSEDFRFEAWIKLEAPTNAQGKRYGIMYHENRFGLRLEDDTSGWRLNFMCWGSPTSQSVYATYADHQQWHHVVAEFYKGRMTIYIDGRVKGNRKDNTPDYVNSNPPNYMYIGAREASHDVERFEGFIDEVRFSKASAPDCCEYNIADINQDCYVDAFDLMLMAEQWLGTSN